MHHPKTLTAETFRRACDRARAQGRAQARDAALNDLLNSRPLQHLDEDDFFTFLQRSGLYAHRSRCRHPDVATPVPARSVTARVALKSVRARLERIVAASRLVAACPAEDDAFSDEDDDEAVVMADQISDEARQALVMLAVLELAAEFAGVEMRAALAAKESGEEVEAAAA